MRWIASFVVATLALVSAASAQTHTLGPAIGATLPMIEAPDQDGATRSLSSLAGPNGLVLLVTRSADWCPFCQVQMVGLEGMRGEIERRGWRLAAITTDTIAEHARFAAMRDIGYPMLSDAQAAIVRQLGLLDPTQPPGSRHNGLPVPTLLFVSPEGVVRAKLGDANYRVRPAPETVLATLDGLG